MGMRGWGVGNGELNLYRHDWRLQRQGPDTWEGSEIELRAVSRIFNLQLEPLSYGI